MADLPLKVGDSAMRNQIFTDVLTRISRPTGALDSQADQNRNQSDEASALSSRDAPNKSHTTGYSPKICHKFVIFMPRHGETIFADDVNFFSALVVVFSLLFSIAQ
jgi:hypothetical protein